MRCPSSNKESFFSLQENETVLVTPTQPKQPTTKFSFPPVRTSSTSNSFFQIKLAIWDHQAYMEILNNRCSFIRFSSFIIISGLVSFTLCLAAEFKKSKKNDLRLDGKQCYLPESSAFGLGVGALICLSVTQVIGNLFIYRKFHSTGHIRGCGLRKPSVSCILPVFSWIFFVLAVILISTATTMNRNQPFGEGWLDGECYLVKNGVYSGSAVLSLLALSSILGSGAIKARQRQAEENRKARAQIGE